MLWIFDYKLIKYKYFYFLISRVNNYIENFIGFFKLKILKVLG